MIPMRSANSISIPKKFMMHSMENISMEKLQVSSTEYLIFISIDSLRDFSDTSTKARGYVQHGIYQNVSRFLHIREQSVLFSMLNMNLKHRSNVTNV